MGEECSQEDLRLSIESVKVREPLQRQMAALPGWALLAKVFVLKDGILLVLKSSSGYRVELWAEGQTEVAEEGQGGESRVLSMGQTDRGARATIWFLGGTGGALGSEKQASPSFTNCPLCAGAPGLGLEELSFVSHPCFSARRGQGSEGLPRATQLEVTSGASWSGPALAHFATLGSQAGGCHLPRG